MALAAPHQRRTAELEAAIQQPAEEVVLRVEIVDIHSRLTAQQIHDAVPRTLIALHRETTQGTCDIALKGASEITLSRGTEVACGDASTHAVLACELQVLLKRWHLVLEEGARGLLERILKTSSVLLVVDLLIDLTTVSIDPVATGIEAEST